MRGPSWRLPKSESYLPRSFFPLLHNYKILQKLSVSSGLSMGPHCILERVAILEASSPTVSTIVYASERAYSIWPSDSAAEQAWRFVVVFVLKLGVKMKWRSPHTRDWECIFNLFSAYQPGRTAGDRRRGGKERGREGKKRKRGIRRFGRGFNPTMMKPLKWTAAGRHTP